MTVRFTRLLLAALLALCACTHTRAHNQRPPRPSAIVDSPLRFVFFDLGQADSMLVIYKGKTLLMDAGESRTAHDQNKWHVIGKTLEELTGRRHLDLFVVSHYHSDHVGQQKEGTGLWGLLGSDGVTIDTLIDRGPDIWGDSGKGETQKEYERSVPGWLSSGKVKQHRVVHGGEQLELGEGLKIDVVAANGVGALDVLYKTSPQELEAFPASENDYSVALKFTYLDFELFAGGDLTGQTLHREFGAHREGYHDVESATAALVGDVEVYRVDHHGSDHSSNPCFANVLHPEVSIISSGDNNYGHPAIKVFDRLSDLGHVYITGGADSRVQAHVERAIVGGAITLLVDASGKLYSVNGKDFRSRSEEAEAQRAGLVTRCGDQQHASGP